MTVRSPSAFISMTERSERPMSRWISCVRPETRPRMDSRDVRVSVELGSREYSAVSQPSPLPFRKPGTRSSIVAAQITLVLPTSMSTEPAGYR